MHRFEVLEGETLLRGKDCEVSEPKHDRGFHHRGIAADISLSSEGNKSRIDVVDEMSESKKSEISRSRLRLASKHRHFR